MRAPVARVDAGGPAEWIALVLAAQGDISEAGNVSALHTAPADAVEISVELADEPAA